MLRCTGTAVLSVLAALPAAGAAPRLAPSEGWPGGMRAALVAPSVPWQQVLAGLGLPPGARLGYSREEMSRYGRDRHRLRTVDELFADALVIPRVSGRLAEELLGDGANVAEIVRRGYLLTDISAGRMLPLAERPGWGFPVIPEDAAPLAALEAFVGWAPPGGVPGSLTTADREALARLPEPVLRLTVRLLVGAAEASPWLAAAFDVDALRRATATAAGKEPARAALHELASAPWREVRLDQLATLERPALELLDQVDRDYLAFGSAVALVHLGEALEEWRATAPAQRSTGFEGCLRFTTALGDVAIAGVGDDHHGEPALIAIDLAGDDSWRGGHGAPLTLATALGFALDLDGDDRWQQGEAPAALGAGLFGIGVLVDEAGDDRYQARGSGLAAAWYGTGVLLDRAGDDLYEGGRWTQAAAHAGVAALVDLAGNDRFLCDHESQAMGATLGAGLLIDSRGDDTYIARDDGNISALYLGQSVAMAQGVGYGRRADLGDGHSLAGGFGVLVDGTGNDRYHAQVWAQGAGYWWGAGMLEDLAGDDVYENGKYSLGAAAHFAIGVQVDLEGDDRYNVGNRTAVNQFQGHARDGSIGVSIDGDGDDAYELRSHSGGSGDLGSIGLFWDRRGNDCYTIRDGVRPGSPDGSLTPALGSATRYPPFRSFRDELGAFGAFLDTGGRDDYRTSDGTAGDSALWRRVRDPRSHGAGLDLDWYDPGPRP